MTDAIPSEINELLERRSTYADWLERLSEVADDARPEVVERIRADYRDRLEDVRSELGEHREDLAEDLAERTDRVERLEAEREEKLARREEAEIRHRVGEFAQDEWETQRRELDRTIGQLEDRLDGEQEAISQLRSALEVMDESSGRPQEVRGEPGADDRPEEPVAEADDRPPLRLVEEEREAEEEAPAVEVEEEEEAAASEEEAPAAGGGSADELAGDEPARAEGEAATTRRERPDVEEEPEEVEAEEIPPAEGPPAGDVEPPAVEERSASEERSAAEEERPEAAPSDEEAPDGAYDELEFLESLSLEDTDQFDAVSAMLDEAAEEEDEDDEDDEGSPEDGTGSGPSHRRRS